MATFKVYAADKGHTGRCIGVSSRVNTLDAESNV